MVIKSEYNYMFGKWRQKVELIDVIIVMIAIDEQHIKVHMLEVEGKYLWNEKSG